MAGRETTSLLVLILIALPVLVFAIQTVRTEPSRKEDREYKEGDYIPLFANTAFPNQNPCEAYSYFDLPFCPPGDPIPNRKKSLEEVIAGDCYMNTGYELRFKKETKRKLLCEKNLKREEVAKFRDAIAADTVYEMYYDNIRLREQVGVNATDPYIEMQWFHLINHLDFHFRYLGNRVKEVYVLGDIDSAVDVTDEDAEIKVNFTYSVIWGDLESKEENQDKVRLRGICILFVLAYTGHLYVCSNKSLYIPLIVIYSLASCLSGYKATSFHSGFTTHGWIECVIHSGALYLVPVILAGLVVTILAITIGEVLDLPEFDEIAYYIIIYLFIGISFLTVSGISGRTSLNESEITCSTRHFQNEITNQAWYMRTPIQMFLGGFLPFSLIFSMMDDIYASLYNLKVCGAFSTMFTAFISIIALTVFVGIICTWSQLYKQDHQWWWRSVFRGGSVAIFMFAYGLYFYARANARISMNLIVFLGYNACIFYAVFLMLGTIGFYASSIGFHYMGRVLRRR
ncbi:transmembrane 9 superfamily member 4-like [Quercus lobata]|uniref:transmembrane 9 superfamily member 4-like n=1 Tax=Quercus lobata TaxID=97700 RepID=UPI0012444A4D|nr:transmembrane 9 superfamily member 4-like [Quercus lobata]